MPSEELHGADWADSFLRRHHDVSTQHTARNITRAHAATDEEIINNLFKNLENKFKDFLLQVHGIMIK
jgi:hypothetical protein